jgi:hypothetical protein
LVDRAIERSDRGVVTQSRCTMAAKIAGKLMSRMKKPAAPAVAAPAGPSAVPGVASRVGDGGGDGGGAAVGDEPVALTSVVGNAAGNVGVWLGARGASLLKKFNKKEKGATPGILDPTMRPRALVAASLARVPVCCSVLLRLRRDNLARP